ncbi:MAG: DUF2934 domain-containing protein [Gammaproteobacteria bacterium]|nr:DUF2934 domain-containing protein [Gammaproteobacteria bacterium]
MYPTNLQAPGTPTTEERRKMIEIAAYFLAEHRGFAPGGADADWLRAEQAIDAMIADGLHGDSVHPAVLTEGIRNALKLGRGLSGGPAPGCERV